MSGRLSNVDQEGLWIDGWNDLYDLIETNPEAYLVLPEYIQTDIDGAQQWIQDAAYNGFKTRFELGYYKGRLSIFIDKLAHDE